MIYQSYSGKVWLPEKPLVIHSASADNVLVQRDFFDAEVDLLESSSPLILLALSSRVVRQ